MLDVSQSPPDVCQGIADLATCPLEPAVPEEPLSQDDSPVCVEPVSSPAGRSLGDEPEAHSASPDHGKVKGWECSYTADSESGSKAALFGFPSHHGDYGSPRRAIYGETARIFGCVLELWESDLVLLGAGCEVLVERRALWDALRAVSVGASPWIVGGDFNTVLSPDERSGGSARAVAHLELSKSDHCGLLVEAECTVERKGSSFRFQHMWTTHSEFLWVVRRNWQYPTRRRGLKEADGVYDQDPCDRMLVERNRCSAELKRRFRGTIFGIQHEGAYLTDPTAIKDSAASFFQRILTAETVFLEEMDSEYLEDGLTDEDRGFLCVMPTLEGVREAVFSIEPDSVAGPDGFGAVFFHTCWEIISEDVFGAVTEFFRGEKMPKGFTATTISIIPKTTNPTCCSEYRPISLCNVTNKICTKLMTIRLGHVLPKVTSLSQSGFVPGRLLSDNVLLAQELIHSLESRRPDANVVFKLDMTKACDRVSWEFLYQILQRKGFPQHWIGLVANAISHCWFSVLVNGEHEGFFHSTRGLRQGDPLSPALFVLAADYLSRGLERLFAAHPMMFYQAPGLIRVSHQAFADDLMIFTTMCCQNMELLRDFLRAYERVSGQLINCSKSSFIVGRQASSLQTQAVQDVLGYQLKHLPITYLGVPLYKGNRKACLFDPIISRLRDLLQGWAMTNLSQGGSFFWGSYNGRKHIHWSSWAKACFPVAEGGLGVRSLADYVPAFSLKLWWRFRGKSSYGRSSVSFWHDNWFGEKPLAQLVHRDTYTMESLHYYWHEGDWNVPRILRIIPMPFAQTICQIPIAVDQGIELCGRRLVRGFLDEICMGAIRQASPRRQLLADVWHRSLRPTISVFLETVSHLFIESVAVQGVWQHFAAIFGLCLCDTRSLTHMVHFWRYSTPFHSDLHIRTLIPFLILWFTWTQRNVAKYRGVPFSIDSIILEVQRHLRTLDQCAGRAHSCLAGDGACPDPWSCPLGGGGECHDGDLALKVPCFREVGGSTYEMRIVCLQQLLVADVQHVFREANGAADHLAKEAASLQLTRVLHHDDITVQGVWQHFAVIFGLCLCDTGSLTHMRNAAKYHGVPLSTDGIILEVQRYLRTPYAARTLTSTQWKGDLHRVAVIDGSSLGNLGLAGAAGIIRDSAGHVHLAYQFALGSGTSVLAELTAVWRGSRAFGKWEVQHLIMRIVRLQQLLRADVQHIFREANGAADHLVKEAASLQLTRVLHHDDITGVLHAFFVLTDGQSLTFTGGDDVFTTWTRSFFEEVLWLALA
ncbi:UNVERIFIED_CONTAM: hypothetical protein Scaly_1914700 [Sesamum calycinum]|uniref:Reverse transcriptase domain-containing protein n=1 Tax=Sesamum calycinum TaxID=2727403 RepID=A0AAW2NJ09_9LAMI